MPHRAPQPRIPRTTARRGEGTPSSEPHMARNSIVAGCLMPISREKAKNYPGGGIHSKEWKTIRALILDRAGDCCEGTPNFPDCRVPNYSTHPDTGGKVILTIAHMDHDESHGDPERLRALCQRCHNQWDAPFRRANIAARRRRELGNLELFQSIRRG